MCFTVLQNTHYIYVFTAHTHLYPLMLMSGVKHAIASTIYPKYKKHVSSFAGPNLNSNPHAIAPALPPAPTTPLTAPVASVSVS
jgi:hypothetical protein